MKHFDVVAAVLIKDNRVFCAQRKDAGETAKKWEFPGGKIEVGEQPQQALVREIAEELLTKIEVSDHLISVNHQYHDFAITLHAYLATILSGTLVLSEHLDSRWLSRNELTSVDWAAADLLVVDKVRQLLR